MSGQVKEGNFCLTVYGENHVVEWKCFSFWMFPNFRKNVSRLRPCLVTLRVPMNMKINMKHWWNNIDGGKL